MKKRLVSAAALLAAIGCLQAPTPSAAQSVTPAGPPDTVIHATTATIHPISRTLFAEAIARYAIGAGHRAMYANITGNQMWSITESTFGKPDAQSAIYEARRLCEEHAVANRLDPGKCVPVAVGDRQVYDPAPLFAIAEQLRTQQLSIPNTQLQE